MSGIDTYYIFIVVIAVFGIFSIILHIRTYQHLYSALKKRKIVEDDFAPDWTSKIGSYGCMGYISRIKKEVGITTLNDSESSLYRKTVFSYYVGTIATFVAVGIFFWRVYGVAG